jgi:hypothetical protein
MYIFAKISISKPIVGFRTFTYLVFQLNILVYLKCIIANQVMNTINQNKGHLLNNLTNLNWLNQDRVQYYAQSIKTKGGPVRNCWGFIDGRARAICRPSINQEKYFSGHKRHHCVKYQSVLCPDGI